MAPMTNKCASLWSSTNAVTQLPATAQQFRLSARRVCSVWVAGGHSASCRARRFRQDRSGAWDCSRPVRSGIRDYAHLLSLVRPRSSSEEEAFVDFALAKRCLLAQETGPSPSRDRVESPRLSVAPEHPETRWATNAHIQVPAPRPPPLPPSFATPPCSCALLPSRQAHRA